MMNISSVPQQPSFGRVINPSAVVTAGRKSMLIETTSKDTQKALLQGIKELSKTHPDDFKARAIKGGFIFTTREEGQLATLSRIACTFLNNKTIK